MSLKFTVEPHFDILFLSFQKWISNARFPAHTLFPMIHLCTNIQSHTRSYTRTFKQLDTLVKSMVMHRKPYTFVFVNSSCKFTSSNIHVWIIITEKYRKKALRFINTKLNLPAGRRANFVNDNAFVLLSILCTKCGLLLLLLPVLGVIAVLLGIFALNYIHRWWCTWCDVSVC